jgi:hypothetical protein
MTEAEWLTPRTTALLKRIGAGARPRRLRLFACACCRRAHWLGRTDPFYDHLRLVEDYADGKIDERARACAQEAMDGVVESQIDNPRRCLWRELYWAAAQPLLLRKPSEFGQGAAAAFGWLAGTGPKFDAAKRVERAEQAPLVRDIFGKSFYKKARIQRRWRTDTVLTLARQMYESREFSAMPILADALQDAGCDCTAVLDHCREPEPHVRGCWVVDLVLGKG